MTEVVVTDEFKTWYEALSMGEQEVGLSSRDASRSPWSVARLSLLASSRSQEPTPSGSAISRSARRKERIDALMKVHRFGGLKHKLSRERQDRIRKEAEDDLLEMDLRELRELLGKTQQEIAVLIERSQGQVSETERRQDLRLSTLRSYVEALGGELEVIASFGDKRIKLHSA